MPEQLAFQQGVRQGATVDLHEGLSGARRIVVYSPRDHCLARAAFSGKQDRGVCAGDNLDLIQDLLHLLVLADEIFELEAHVELPAELIVLFQQLLVLQCALHGQVDLFIGNGLREVVEGSHLNGLHGIFDAPVAGEHDDRRGQAVLVYMFQQVETIAIPQFDIGQEDLIVGFFQYIEGFIEFGGCVYVIILVREILLQTFQNQGVVVNDQNTGLLSHCCPPSRARICGTWLPSLRDRALCLLLASSVHRGTWPVPGPCSCCYPWW